MRKSIAQLRAEAKEECMAEYGFDSIDMRAYWDGTEPDEETKRRIKLVFHTPERQRIIWGALYRFALEAELKAKNENSDTPSGGST